MNTAETASKAGWFKSVRSPEALELMEANPNAFMLLFIIAYRAQRTDSFNKYNLKPGQALVGGTNCPGLTRQNYRTAKEFLEKHEFSTFKSTNKGTVATLSDTRVFDINVSPGNQQDNQRVTNGQPAGNQQGNQRVTTTKNVKNGKNGKNGKKGKKENGEASPSPAASSFVQFFEELLRETGYEGNVTDTQRKNWADTYDRLVRLDKKTDDEIRAVCQWARGDNFWATNFLTAVKLRRNDKDGVRYFDKFKEQMRQLPAKPSSDSDPDEATKRINSPS